MQDAAARGPSLHWPETCRSCTLPHFKPLTAYQEILLQAPSVRCYTDYPCGADDVAKSRHLPMQARLIPGHHFPTIAFCMLSNSTIFYHTFQYRDLGRESFSIQDQPEAKMAGPSPERFQRALTSFRCSLSTRSPDLLDEFSFSSLQDLQIACNDMQNEMGQDGRLRRMRRIGGFIEAMRQLGESIEVFVNANDLVCFIWVSGCCPRSKTPCNKID